MKATLRYLVSNSAILCLTALVGFAQTSSGEPKVRHGINPAKMERNSRPWQYAASEVAFYNKMGFPKAVEPQDRVAKLIHGGRAEKMLALTFDDGPHPKYTDALLDILKKENVKATFFVVGKMGVLYPKLLQDISEQGHELANHTFSHVTLTNLKPDEIETEYQADNDVIYSATGERPRYCRPPGGRYDDNVVKAGLKLGMATVLWTDDPGDYEKPSAATLEKKTLSKLNNGGIVLLHSGVQSTLDILPDLIHYAKGKGFKFVLLDKMEESCRREEIVALQASGKKHKDGFSAAGRFGTYGVPAANSRPTIKR